MNINSLVASSPDWRMLNFLKKFFLASKKLHEFEIKNNGGGKLVHAYHDVSDGGLFTCLCEMAFAARVGIDINVDLLTRLIQMRWIGEVIT